MPPQVTLETPDGAKTFECPGDSYILDKALQGALGGRAVPISLCL